MGKKGFSLGGLRSVLYGLARLLGDFQALSSGRPDKMAKRLARRAAGRVTGRWLGRLFR